MDWKTVLFQAIGGLGLFLMGMKIMSEGMQKVAGDRLKNTLNFLTRNRFMAIGMGMMITAVIQSSSATTVMTVGFVNAALMSLEQAIGVVLGANIGTTITGWIVTLKIVKFSLPMIGIGVLIKLINKKEKWNYTGEIIYGFGILFLGMQTMKQGFAPLRESPDFIQLFTNVDGSGFTTIILGVLIGTLTTVIVQSSSATIGITIALASQGLLNYEGAVSLILGDNIGTTITAILASISGNYHAKRAAAAHTMFNVLGVVIILLLFVPFTALIDYIVPGQADYVVTEAGKAAIGSKPYIGKHIAMAHTVFNITNVIVFTALIPFLAALCRKIIPEPAVKKYSTANLFKHIDNRYIETPNLGIAETEKELAIMGNKVSENISILNDLIHSKESPAKHCDKILKHENSIDEYQKSIVEFLVSLSSNALSESNAQHVGNYITLAHNLEKFGDFIENTAKTFDKAYRKNIKFSDQAKQNINEIFNENNKFYTRAMEIFNSESSITNEEEANQFMDSVYIVNRRIKKLIKQAKLSHFERVGKKACDTNSALFYIDILNYLDGMRSQAYNISEVTSGSKYSLA